MPEYLYLQINEFTAVNQQSSSDVGEVEDLFHFLVKIFSGDFGV